MHEVEEEETDMVLSGFIPYLSRWHTRKILSKELNDISSL
jgi:hypothetical protein